MQGLVSHHKDAGWLLLSVKWGSLCRVLDREVTRSNLHVKRILLAIVVREVKRKKDGGHLDKR